MRLSVPGTWVRIPPSPPKEPVIVTVAGFLFMWKMLSCFKRKCRERSYRWRCYEYYESGRDAAMDVVLIKCFIPATTMKFVVFKKPVCDLVSGEILVIITTVSFRDNVPGKGWDGIVEITSLFSRAARHEKGVKRDDFGLLDVKKRKLYPMSRTNN